MFTPENILTRIYIDLKASLKQFELNVPLREGFAYFITPTSKVAKRKK